MEPDDVIIEAIAAASLNGDSPELRVLMCTKLKEAIERSRFHVEPYANVLNAKDE